MVRLYSHVDAELVLQAMIDYEKYDTAVIVTSDGDFRCIVDYFYHQKKLNVALSPNREKCSILLTKAARERIHFLDNLEKKLAYTNEKAPLKDGT